MQIDTKVFVPYTLHYEASPAAAASSPIHAFCSTPAAVAQHPAATADDEADANVPHADASDASDASAAGQAEQPLVIVTAASSDFFNNSLNLIGR
jgi:hypothetical protein